MNAGVEACLLARFTNALLNQIGSFLIHLLDARRIDATVCDKVLESDASRLATNRIEAGENNRFGVSSITRFTPETCSKVRILRPSRPMILPLRSSDGICTEVTVTSAVWSAAQRWMAGIISWRVSALGLNLLLAIADNVRLHG